MSPSTARKPEPFLSARRIIESLIVACLLWLVQAVYTQNNMLVALAAHFDDVSSKAAQVPDLQKSVGQLDIRVANNERRLSALESRGGAP